MSKYLKYHYLNLSQEVEADRAADKAAVKATHKAAPVAASQVVIVDTQVQDKISQAVSDDTKKAALVRATQEAKDSWVIRVGDLVAMVVDGMAMAVEEVKAVNQVLSSHLAPV